MFFIYVYSSATPRQVPGHDAQSDWTHDRLGDALGGTEVAGVPTDSSHSAADRRLSTDRQGRPTECRGRHAALGSEVEEGRSEVRRRERVAIGRVVIA